MFSRLENYESFHPSSSLRESAALGEIQSVFGFDDSITDIIFSLKRVKILKKKDFLNKAEIYIGWIVTDDSSDDPIKIRNSSVFEKVKNGDELPLGPSGITMYRNDSGKLPNFLDFRILILESDEGARAFGAAIEELRKTDEYKALRDAIIKATIAATPTAALVTAGADFALRMLAKSLSMNQDDQLLLVEGSYDRKFDDLGVIYGLVKKKSRFSAIEFQTFKA